MLFRVFFEPKISRLKTAFLKKKWRGVLGHFFVNQNLLKTLVFSPQICLSKKISQGSEIPYGLSYPSTLGYYPGFSFPLKLVFDWRSFRRGLRAFLFIFFSLDFWALEEVWKFSNWTLNFPVQDIWGENFAQFKLEIYENLMKEKSGWSTYWPEAGHFLSHSKVIDGSLLWLGSKEERTDILLNMANENIRIFLFLINPRNTAKF